MFDQPEKKKKKEINGDEARLEKRGILTQRDVLCTA
jgi:hypothetical protein